MSDGTKPPSMTVAARFSTISKSKAALTTPTNQPGLIPKTISRMTLNVAAVRSTQPSGSPAATAPDPNVKRTKAPRKK